MLGLASRRLYHTASEPQPSRCEKLPRKRAKFINFAKSEIDLDFEMAESLWSLIEASAADVPKPAVAEEPVANAAPASAGPEFVSHQAPSPRPPTSCGMVAFLMRRMGIRGTGRAGAAQTPPNSNDEPVGGGLDGWSADLNAEDQTAKQALPTLANLPLPMSLPPPRRWSPSRSLFKRSTRSSQETSTPAPHFMRQSSTRSSTRSSTDAIAAPRAAPPPPSPNLERVEITLLKPAQPRQDALAVPSLGLHAPVPPRGALGGPPKAEATGHR